MNINGHINLCEDYVSFEIAKLLKEKGFDEPCFALYNPEGVLIQCGIRLNNTQVGRISGSYSASTHQMVMKWLREVHNISIEVVYDCSNDKTETISWWLANIKHINSDSSKENDCLTSYNSYEESCEAAIKYCLEKLI